VLSLLLCGPFGLILVWLKPQWTTKSKGVVTGVVGAIVVISMIGGALSPPPETSTEASRAVADVSPTTTSSAATEPPVTSATSLDGVGAVPSPVESFPVPATAIETTPLTVDSAADGYWEAEVEYALPEGISGDQLRSWYATVQPVERPFGAWGWCEDASEGSSDLSIHVWSKPGVEPLNGSPVDSMYDMTVLVLSIYNTTSPVTFSVTKELSGGPCFPDPPGASPPPTMATSRTTTAPASFMPDVVGMNLQAAQDLIQAATDRFFSSSIDCTGEGRMQVNDRNWVVVAQDPAPGSPITEAPVLGVVKYGERLAC
jgi:hypothetical protein